ncbi:AAA family ATPase [Oscillatoria acuminata]|uniref:Putative ATP-binding protein involved in virulence n=1 Tax=Oscillatoria acuminata PCC 6304 TaxID=56110 RepID=K9TEA5_9CYAN|nr:AAA family ATPase [Oscillatoria acuminata]AFY81207.1 putative ATP-binding protein involved in virulence [Oscillatoria acuminata PCC 6304]
MRIDKLIIHNFKKFSEYSLELHPKFTLLIGDNGTGKTSLLDALAIAAGVWLVNPPDSTLSNSKRNILPNEIRLKPIKHAGITRFFECKPVIIQAIGMIHEDYSYYNHWCRQIKINGSRTSNTEAKRVIDSISILFKRDQFGEMIWFPVIGYYGAGRTWLPSNVSRKTAKLEQGINRRWEAFYDCFEERIRLADLQTWFQKEAIAALQRSGKMRPSYDVVKWAILRCIPGADDLWFDGDRAEIVISLEHQPIPFSNLSAGQKMMVALIADIAIKVVNQNTKFLPEVIDPNPEIIPPILQQTPGLVLIDEIDVHLHPKWQRRIVNDLKTTFPSIQFVCTTHSPQVIGQIEPECLRILYEDNTGKICTITPKQGLGMDSSWILQNLMGASARDIKIEQDLEQIFDTINDENYSQARELIQTLKQKVGDFPELQEATSFLDRLELLKDYETD